METNIQKETEVIKLDTAVVRLSRSQCMQEVFGCLPGQVNLTFMLISKRCYQSFIPPVIAALSIFVPKLLRLFANSTCVEIFSHTSLAWERINVCQANKKLNSAKKYFKGKKQIEPTQSQITQISNSRFLITGGYSNVKSLVPGPYEVARSTLLLLLDTASFEEKPLMTSGRYAHSVAVVGHQVYVIGGDDPSNDWSVTRVERFDTIVEKWATISLDFDQYAIGTSSITCNARHILTFGGRDADSKYSQSTLIRRFDHLKPMAGWLMIRLDNTKPCHIFKGLMHLCSSSAPEEANNILVFGGYNDDQREKDDSMAVQFETREQAACQHFENGLLKVDTFRQKSVCHLPSSILTTKFVAKKVANAATRTLLGDLSRPHSRLLAAQGDKGLHVFDQTSMTWLFCAKFPVKDI